ncbi:MAG: hypothetical protein ACOY5F_18675 [Pseudomonadota bacterium]
MSDPETPKVTTNDLMVSVEASIRRYHGLIALTLPFNKASIMDALDQAGIATVVVTFDATTRTITFDFNERYTASNNTTHSY